MYPTHKPASECACYNDTSTRSEVGELRVPSWDVRRRIRPQALSFLARKLGYIAGNNLTLSVTFPSLQKILR
jgi:hypothetical protein